MRRKPYLSLLLALAILGGMLALFPTVWMLLVIALLALLTLQVILVRRNLYRLPAGHTQLGNLPGADAAPRRATTAAPAATSTAPSAAPAAPTTSGEAATADGEGTPAAPSAETPAPAGEPAGETAGTRANIDMALFSRFRQHLEQAETGGPPPREPPPPLEDEAVQDRVVLSGAARRPARPRPAQPPAPPRRPTSVPAEDAEGADLFADLRPEPPPASATAEPPSQERHAEPKPAAPEAPAAAEPRHAPEADGPATTAAAESPAPARRPEPDPAPPAGSHPDEVSRALAADASSGTEDPALADEAAALLHMAEEAAAREDWEGLRAGLDNYLAHLADAPRLIDWQGRRLQVRLAVHDGDANRALQGFEELLATGHRPPVDDVPGLLDGLLVGAEPATAASLRVSMLVRILATYRQARDQRAMDRCYGWIEEAQEQVGDERRLLQYLKNHLEIRKVLGDVPGQLELIDQLGNRCYRLGLTEEAKAYYEMGLRLRADAEGSGAAESRPAPPDAVQEG